MTLTMIFAGSGGQGIQFSGKQMAKTGMYAGYQVTFLPSYGPEMRGGTSNCTVVISDEEIGSPSVSTPDVAVVMNKPSFEKFAPKVKVGGKLFVDATLVDLVTDRTDIEVICIPATGMAEENGLSGFSNVILMGKIIKETGLFGYDEFVNYLVGSIPPAKEALIEKNKKALELGYNA
ncbi:MAG: 2-oxoacid:acceptor oxidoreductase family protein [Clostridia bacterium]|nr:2-oxoacid:acceptor oxidoreductase family protein [Clostridia bacterium]